MIAPPSSLARIVLFAVTFYCLWFPVVASPGEAPSLPLAVDRARAAAAVAATAAGEMNSRRALWSRELAKGEVIEVPVQLYSGNEYAFALGFDGAGAMPQISLRDDRGRLVPAALGRTPGALVLRAVSRRAGVYHLRVAAGPEQVVLALTYVYR